MTTKLYTHHIEDSGVTITIKKVSPLLVAEFFKSNPAPKPPVQEVFIGDPKAGIKEFHENPTHPDYANALREYQQNIDSKFSQFLIRYGTKIELSEDEKADVKALRAQWKEDFDVELPYTDKYVFVAFIAVSTKEALTELLNAIWSRTEVTQEAVDDVTRSFRS